ncbi:hypothetical protein SO802_026740 [Lithocarpus litseifolius]|uniref:Peptidase metallopeptidase domain-containing protein n=1 Tax=Lithocarpus litseifolius TaxID=425828 RepID=A0AAW2C5V2_9ROSI
MDNEIRAVFFFVEFERVLLVQERSDVVLRRAQEFLQLCFDFVFYAGNSIASDGDRFREGAPAEAFGVLAGVLVAGFQQEGSGKVDSEVAALDRFVGDKERDCGGGGGWGWSCGLGRGTWDVIRETRSKWLASKYNLTYGFLPSTPAEAMNPVAQAFQTWAANTHFTFLRTQDYTNADLKISFHKGDHGDSYPFNGAGGSIAHAFSPTDGRFHYDANEQWSVEATLGVVSYETVALHEIGHLFGLEHSSVEGAIMWPKVRSGVIQADLTSSHLKPLKLISPEAASPGAANLTWSCLA